MLNVGGGGGSDANNDIGQGNNKNAIDGSGYITNGVIKKSHKKNRETNAKYVCYCR